MRRLICLTVLLGFFGVAAESTAWASPILRLEQGTNVVTVADLDHDGFVQYSGMLGGFLLNMSLGASLPSTLGDNLALLDLFSMSLSYDVFRLASPSTLTITLADTNYTLPVTNGTPVSAKADVGGTLIAGQGSSVSFQSWINLDNLSPLPTTLPSTPTSIPEESLALFTPAAAFSTSSFSRSNSTSFLYSGPFSMFSQATITMNGPGLVGFDQSVLATVPEPATLGLLGIGLVGLAGFAKRRLRRPQS